MAHSSESDLWPGLSYSGRANGGVDPVCAVLARPVGRA